MAMNTSPLEKDEGKVLVAWLRINHIPFTHIPNETGHDEYAKRRAIRMKQQGTSKGFPDYIIFLVNVGIIFIELKRQTGSSTSIQQKEWIEIINKTPGSAGIIAKGAQEAIDFISSFRVSKPVKPVDPSVEDSDVF